MISCPRCDREMIWQNDYDYGDGSEETYTDYSCLCGVFVTVPWHWEEGTEPDAQEDE